MLDLFMYFPILQFFEGTKCFLIDQSGIQSSGRFGFMQLPLHPWALYCIVTGIVLFDKEELETVPQRLSPVFSTRPIIPGDVDSMSQGFQELLDPSAQTRSDSAAHREAQRAQDARIAEVNERNRRRDEHNNGYVWRALSNAIGYPIAWLGALLTLFEVRSRLETEDQ